VLSAGATFFGHPLVKHYGEGATHPHHFQQI
jgi:hypothetical protein